MGHRKHSAPRHGSLAYHPRKRASNFTGRWRSWGNISYAEPTILGFAAYKAGMTHVILVEDKKTSPYYGHEVSRAATVLDTPPTIVCAIRAYRFTNSALKVLGEVWAGELSEDLRRKFPTPKEYSMDKALLELEKQIKNATELRLILHTQPRLTSLSKKKPDIFESKIEGGSITDQWKFAKELLGNELKVSSTLKEGDFIDVSAVTKGKGFQGPMKKFGIKKLPRKSRKTVRGVGSIGPWTPGRTMWTIARSGQMGFHQRVEYNKRILKIGIDPKEIIPAGGFLNYGLIRGDYLLVLGSIPGTRKRMIRLRKAIRPPKNVPDTPPDLVYIS
ncbi:MAG: 50S ribosomal protein L3, partial [Candidatus Helarchaeota archaeon]|nr:50S ribosomal protein L3 [Candidatus Helarchaeota archaeon]